MLFVRDAQVSVILSPAKAGRRIWILRSLRSLRMTMRVMLIGAKHLKEILQPLSGLQNDENMLKSVPFGTRLRKLKKEIVKEKPERIMLKPNFIDRFR